MGDGWLPALCTPEDAADGKRVIDEVAAEHGRSISPEHFGVSIAYAPEGTDFSAADLRGAGGIDQLIGGRCNLDGAKLDRASLQEMVTLFLNMDPDTPVLLGDRIFNHLDNAGLSVLVTINSLAGEHDEVKAQIVAHLIGRFAGILAGVAGANFDAALWSFDWLSTAARVFSLSGCSSRRCSSRFSFAATSGSTAPSPDSIASTLFGWAAPFVRKTTLARARP